MKKSVLLAVVILFVLLLLTIAGCYEQPAPTSIPQTSIPTTTTSPTTTPPITPAPLPSTPAPTQGELRVHFIDVGQGDSILIDLGETEVLIDGGEKLPGVVPYLEGYVDGPLEVMIATHPHADHIGGLITVLNAFQVEQIWHNGDTSTSKTYTEFMSAVQSEGAQVYTGKRGDTINAGELAFTILNPATLAGTTNNNSIVVSLSYGDVDFLFTGDAEQEAEAAMLIASDIPVPEVEILKVGHHGSRTASSKDFLTVTSPEVAVYMAGKDNSYGHPHPETLDALAQIGAKIYGTDVNGTIIVATDDQGYTIQTTE